MSGFCPSIGPDTPLVRGLLGSVDCNVQGLVQAGYAALLQGPTGFAEILTALMTIYVAVIGYRLMLGRAGLSPSQFALTAVKLGVVLTLATQWSAYQTLVYRFLFDGPQQLADGILHQIRASGGAFHGNVFDGLQRAFTDLTQPLPAPPQTAPFAAAATSQAPIAPAPLGLGPPRPLAGQPAAAGPLAALGGPQGVQSLMLLASAGMLLLSTVGVLLAAKIVLAVLLALGPVFVTLLLFDSTRGLFQGWLRASLGFAFVPMAMTLLLALGLTLLEPSLQRLEGLHDAADIDAFGVAFGIMVLVSVLTAVAAGLLIAGGVIAAGLKLPQTPALQAAAAVAGDAAIREAQVQPRAARTAAALAARDRRIPAAAAEAAGYGPISTASDRRLTLAAAATPDGAASLALAEGRLGQSQPRRHASPRTARSRGASQ